MPCTARHGTARHGTARHIIPLFYSSTLAWRQAIRKPCAPKKVSLPTQDKTTRRQDDTIMQMRCRAVRPSCRRVVLSVPLGFFDGISLAKAQRRRGIASDIAGLFGTGLTGFTGLNCSGDVLSGHCHETNPVNPVNPVKKSPSLPRSAPHFRTLELQNFRTSFHFWFIPLCCRLCGMCLHTKHHRR